MSLKNLFKPKVETALTKASAIQVDVATSDFIANSDDVKQKADFDKKIFAFVDISSSLTNYVRYGLAEQHYETGIQRIYNDYPFDGTSGDKYKFLNESTTFDYYIWKDLYPKTTGYISLNEDGSSNQRVEIKNGPSANTTFDTGTLQVGSFEHTFNNNNTFTIEFWAKPTTGINTGGIFEMVDSTGNYTALYLNVGAADAVEFVLEKSSSVGGIEANTTFDSLAGNAANWHHYALVVELNSSNRYVSTLYVDGEFNQQKTDSNTVSTELRPVSGNVGYAQTNWYKGKVDEFRFWRTARTEREIGLNYNTHVDGGLYTTTNSQGKQVQKSAIGLYLKFNEGITTNATIDAKVLDYSGMIASASIINYDTSVRSTGSAIQEYNSTFYEVPDPIIYSTHPLVSALETSKVLEGRIYDKQNYHNFYALMPEWIKDQDTEDLKYISHIIGSYFDELFALVSTFEKVKDKTYQDQDLKIFPYYNRLLEGEGFILGSFLDGALLAEINDKTTVGNLTNGSINDLKNKVYRNIYNNLLYIYKSKGTQGAIRNLLHCYGVDQNLVRLRSFANFTTTTIDNLDEVDSFKDKAVDFYGLKNFVAKTTLPNESIIFNYTSSDGNNQSYVSALGDAFSIESNVYFPLQPDSNTDFYFAGDTSGSIFGVHSADASAPTDTTFSGSDYSGMAVYSVHAGKTQRQGKFVLSSSNGYFTAVETDTFDIFDSTNWNLALVVQPKGDARNLPAGGTPEYWARLIGYQVDSGFTVNSFNITSSISAANAALLIAENRRVFVGAERTNFTGSVLFRSQARIGNCKYFADSLEEDEVYLHAKYKNSEGRLRPFENANRKNGDNTTFVPYYLTKVFEWDFEQVDQPNGSGQFTVLDTTSASLDYANAFGGYGTAASKVYTGFGYDFPTDIKVYENEYVSKVRAISPEESTAANVINAQGESTITFQPNEAPAKEAVIFGKSMYDVISGDILKAFAGIKDFNWLIGNPVNKYRENYKDLEALRRLYFNTIENDPKLEKFTKYFKWLDGIIDTAVANLLPATTDLASSSPDVIESHVLERSKFPLKYPTLENKAPKPTATINKIVSLKNVQLTTSTIDDNRAGSIAPISFASSSARTPNYVNAVEIGAQQPVSGSVTPVSISNRPFITSSQDGRVGSSTIRNFASSTIGNYAHTYEVVQAVGQKGAFNGKYLANESTPSAGDNAFVSGVYNYEFVERNKYKTVFRSIFNAPGSPETYGAGLDTATREYSPNNQLNYRNLSVRIPLDELLTIPSAFGGYQSGSSVTASFHKTQRNGYTRKVYSGSSVVDDKVWDNYWVQTQIPATDLGYAWIAESYQSADLNRYQTGSQLFPNEQITFLSASDIGSKIIAGSRYYPVTKALAGTEFIFDNFVGLNYHVYEPITSSQNILGYPSGTPYIFLAGTSYVNKDIVEATIPQNVPFVLNTILNNRNGPYGYPAWKAYRKESHPIVRAHRETNTISYLTSTQLPTKWGGLFLQYLNNVTQTPVSTTDPLFIQLAGTTFDLKTTYENRKLGFTQKSLQTFKGSFETTLQNRETFLSKVLAEETLKIEKLSLRNSIYPLKDNQFLELTRARDQFDNAWWRDSRADRQQTNVTNSFGFGVDGTTSRWSLDARVDFSASAATQPLSTDIASGSGELQNHYTTFHFFPDTTIATGSKFAPMYNRRTIDFIFEAGSYISGITQYVTGGILNVGEALWEVGSQSGKNPFYNSYEKYAEELRLRGKDSSIVPEFRISEHIDTYLSNGFDFSAQLASFLSLTGASGMSVKRYSSAEISDVVGSVKEEVELGVKKFGLKAKALLKLLPYEGFYPQQRTIQLAQELSRSYSDALEGFSENNLSYKNPQQFFYEALVSPGILFNTIKSGLAVDYPIYRLDLTLTPDPTTFFLASSGLGGDLTNKILFDPTGPEWTSRWRPGIANAAVPQPISSSDPVVNAFQGITSSFPASQIERIPFEAILDPKSNFEGKYEQYDPNNLAKNTGSYSLVNGAPKVNYTLFANNFFAETTNFFLKDGLVSFESADKSVFKFEVGKEYSMDFTLTNSDVNSVTSYYDKIASLFPQITGTDVLNDLLVNNASPLTASVQCLMYESEDAFGFPSTIEMVSGSLGPRIPKRGNFTPPYYHGFARARYTFRPLQATYTMDEVVSNLSISYLRADENILSVVNQDSRATWITSYNEAPDSMNISSSFIMDAVIETKKTTFDEGGNVISIEPYETPRKKLVIHSKYECPILNFNNVEITRGGLTKTPKGMWHQYGEIPDYSRIGVFARIADLPRAEKITPILTASLADALGIKKEKKALGRLAPTRDFEEALVVLPYYVDNTKDQTIRFFELSDTTVSKVLTKANKKSVATKDDQLVRQARLMKKYVFPPFMDWVTAFPADLTASPSQKDVKKPVMYVFEFNRTLTQQDLADIWQGVLPEVGLKAVEQEAVIDLDTTFDGNSGQPIDVIQTNIKSLLAAGNINLFAEETKGLDQINFTDLNFFVFKVKKRAEYQYSRITQNTTDDQYQFDFKPQGLETELPFFEEFGQKRLSYSYNYPYDFCSLIELAKVDAQIELSGSVED